MANFDSSLVKKNIRHRGVYGGKEQDVTGVIRVADGGSIATSDLIRMAKLGENVRPIRLALTATPVSGTPVLTGATFSAGVSPILTANFKRPDGTEYPPLTENDAALAASLAIPAGLLVATTSVLRPVADSVSAYGPFYATLTPTAAFSVAGGDIDLALTITFVGEQITDGFVYDVYMDPKVSGD